MIKRKLTAFFEESQGGNTTSSKCKIPGGMPRGGKVTVTGPSVCLMQTLFFSKLVHY